MSRYHRRQKLSAEGREQVGQYREDQLHRFLVEDAVKHHATDLVWAIAAYKRIGKLNRRGPEAAFLAVVAEVEQLTGMATMPVASLGDVDLRQLLR